MRNICIIFISILSFNVAYCHSKLNGNGDLNNTPAPPYTQLEPAYQLGDEFENNRLNSAHSSVQTAFRPGVIITKDGDALGGLINFEYPVPADKAIYKPDSTFTDSVFPIHQAKSIVTQFVYSENIPFKGKEEMMPWLAVGKINLYVKKKVMVK